MRRDYEPRQTGIRIRCIHGGFHGVEIEPGQWPQFKPDYAFVGTQGEAFHDIGLKSRETGCKCFTVAEYPESYWRIWLDWGPVKDVVT